MSNVILETKNNCQLPAAIEPLEKDERLKLIEKWAARFDTNTFVKTKDYDFEFNNIEQVMITLSNKEGYFVTIVFSSKPKEDNHPCFLQFAIEADGSIKSKSFSNDKMGEYLLGHSSRKDNLILDIVLKDILDIEQYRRISETLEDIYDT
ncbi:MAG TPA: hypothetical protein PKD37_06440 [Oligoflexia bacterium]|nr:hypothetical protein [Oligoflexia bacterium]HMP27599.1 hypothetical protein [Oligoflexia bacterium]